MWWPAGLGRIIALYHRSSTFYQGIGASISEATMRPNLRCPTRRFARWHVHNRGANSTFVYVFRLLHQVSCIKFLASSFLHMRASEPHVHLTRTRTSSASSPGSRRRGRVSSTAPRSASPSSPRTSWCSASLQPRAELSFLHRKRPQWQQDYCINPKGVRAFGPTLWILMPGRWAGTRRRSRSTSYASGRTSRPA